MELTAANALDFVLTALCCYREARGESIDGKRGVAWAVCNRARAPKWWGNTPASVVTKPWQFSSFNKGDPNVTVWPVDGDPVWLDCCTAALEAMANETPDPTSGATHYYDESIAPPSWTVGATATATIGKLHFYKDVP